MIQGQACSTTAGNISAEVHLRAEVIHRQPTEYETRKEFISCDFRILVYAMNVWMLWYVLYVLLRPYVLTGYTSLRTTLYTDRT